MRKIVDTLASRRAAIWAFAVLVVLALAGAFIPQRGVAAFYDAHYPAWAATLIRALRLHDVYRSWFFIAVLVYILAALLTCTVRRARRLVGIFRTAPSDLTVKPAGFPLLEELGPARDAASLAPALRKLGFRARLVGDAVYGRRRPLAAAGEFLTHLGLIVIFVGAGLRFFGRTEEVFIFEGQTVGLPAVFGDRYELAATKVEEEVDPNSGKTVEYRTRATLYVLGKPVAAKTIEVNGPLLYRGLGIYQSKMYARGMNGLALEVVTLAAGVRPGDYGRAAFAWTIGKEKGHVNLAPGEKAHLGASGFELQYLDYFEHFNPTPEGFEDNNAALNPVAFVYLQPPAGEGAMGVLLRLHPEDSVMHGGGPAFSGGDVTVAFADARAKAVTAGRREYVFASGTTILLGKDREPVALEMAFGEGDDLSRRAISAEFAGPDGVPATETLPFGRRVPVQLRGGTYLLRFVGARMAPVTGLTVSRDPGVALFYVGAALLSLGVCVTMLWRFDEVLLFNRAGALCFAGRSQKGPEVIRSDFERWAAALKRSGVDA